MKTPRSRQGRAWLGVVAVLLFSVSAHEAAAQSYVYRALETLGGDIGVAFAINNHGQVVGFSNLTKNGFEVHATLWSDGKAIDLGTLGGVFSRAVGINDVGQIVGVANSRAAVWNGLIGSYLPPIAGANAGATGVAVRVNNSGQIVGLSDLAVGGLIAHATLWADGVATDLGTLGGGRSDARGINNQGQIVGVSQDAPGFRAAFATTWIGGTAIPYSANPFSGAQDINDSGQAVGFEGLKAALFEPGEDPVLIDPLFEGRAMSINSSGQVVGLRGTFGGGNQHGYLWHGSQAVDLNSFLSPGAFAEGWRIESAEDINDNGWITGTAWNRRTGGVQAFLLTPVPEPETYALIMVGLAITGFVSRRHHRARHKT